MKSVSQLTHPHRPESYDLNSETGTLIGWIPGEIEDNHDPHGIGRVKVRIDIIDPFHGLPVGEPGDANSGYAFLLEEFVVNNRAGGAHRLMPIGTQVALLPMIGDPTKLLVLGAIPSFVDAPSPEVDRSQGLHGTETPGGVVKLGDDVNSAEVQAFPNGVVQSVTSEGSIHRQTDGGATDALRVDGTIIQQNNEGSTMIAPDGTISQINSAQASTTLTTEGEVVNRSATGAEVRVAGDLVELIGPPDKLNSFLEGLSEELSGLGEEFSALLGDLNVFVSTVLDGGVADLLPDVFGEIPGLLGKAQSFVTEHLGKAQELLSKIEGLDLSPEQLGGNIAGEIQTLLNIEGLDAVFEGVDEAIAQFTAGELNPEALISQFNLPGDIAPILMSLRSNPSALYKQLLKGVVGNSGTIDNLLESGIERIIPELSSFLSSAPLDTQGLLDRLPLAQALHAKLPDNIQSLIPPNVLNTISSVQQMVGQVSKLRLDQLGSDIPGAIANIDGLVSGFIGDQLGNIPQTLEGLGQVSELLGGLEGKIGELLGGLEEQVKVLGDLINNVARRGPSFKVFQDAIEAAVDFAEGGGLPSPMLRLGAEAAEISGGIPGAPRLAVNQLEAALESLGSKVFAGGGSAGLATPWGGLSMGSLGASLIAKGKMVLQSFQEGGGAAGMLFDELGGLSLGGFNADGQFANSGSDAFIRMAQGLIQLNPAGNAQGISLTPEGVFLGGVSLDYILERLTYFDGQYSSLFSSLSSLAAQVEALENPVSPTP